MTEMLLETVLSESSISKRHKALLIEAGVSAATIERVGLKSYSGVAPKGEAPSLPPGLPSGILLPIRHVCGRLATVRLFPDPNILVLPPIDLGRFDPTLRQSVDRGPGFEYLPVPFTVIPSGQHRLDLVVLVDDDLAALILAERLGVRTVSSCGDRMPGLAARTAAQLPGVTQVVLVPDTITGDADISYRCKLAALGPLCDDVRIARWDAATAIRSVDPVRLLGKTVAAERLPLNGDGTGKFGHLQAPTLTIRDRIESVIARVALAGVSLACDLSNWMSRRPKLGKPSADYLYKLDRFDEIRTEAETLGCQVALIGGAGIDAVAGGVVRERKDIDLVLVGGGADALERLTDRLLARGFDIRMRASTSQVKLTHGGHRLEIFRLATDDGGGLHFISRNSYYRLGSDAIGMGSIGGRPVPVLRPEYLYLMKQGMTVELTNLRLNSFFERTKKYRIDLAAVEAVTDPSQARGLRSSGVFQSARMKNIRVGLFPRTRRPRPLVTRIAS